jgi:hypothetical protein
VKGRGTHTEAIARGTRCLLAAIAVLITGTAAAPPALAAPTAPREGVYESCALYRNLDICIARLSQIRSGGFDTVLNYAQFHATAAELRAYADAAHSLGLDLIWPLKDQQWWGHGKLAGEYPMLASSCGCSSDRDFVRYVVGLARSHPATWGYYVGDEALPRQARAIVGFSKRVHRLDPEHPRLYVEVGDLRSLSRRLTRFAPGADVVGATTYPVGTVQDLNAVAEVSGVVKSTAERASRSSAIVLQAFSWDQYPGDASAIRLPDPVWPSGEEMRTMRTLAGGHDLVLWYSFFDIERSDQPELHWADLVSASRLAIG